MIILISVLHNITFDKGAIVQLASGHFDSVCLHQQALRAPGLKETLSAQSVDLQSTLSTLLNFVEFVTLV